MRIIKYKQRVKLIVECTKDVNEKCSVRYTWWKKDDDHSVGPVKLENDKSEFIISEFQDDDNGTYTCIVTVSKPEHISEAVSTRLLLGKEY